MAEKTGYPKDMLDLELDLEADLGVDTVKQAEMFAAVREIYNIPRDENRKLRDYPTLGHVIRFVYENRPDLAGTTTPSPAIVEAAATTVPSATVQLVTDDAIREKVLEIVAEKTGYPKDMLDLDLDLEADLGVDTVKQAEMFASVRAAYNIPREENLKLRDFPTLAHVIQFARDKQNLGATVAASAPAAAAPSAAVTKVARPRPALASFDAANRIPRRVPVPTLRPPLTICKPTGVKLGPGSRVVIMPDQEGVANVLAQHLQTLGVEALVLDATLDANALRSACSNGCRRARSRECTGFPRSTTKATFATWSWRDGMKLCGYESNRCTPRCALCTSKSRRLVRSWSRPRNLADNTATTLPEPLPRSAERLSALPRPTSASVRKFT